MKIGSLVECINNSGTKNVQVPKLGKVYTVRAIRTPVDKLPLLGFLSDKTGIMLEEIINPCHKSGHEFGYDSVRFREIQYNSEAIAELVTEKEKVK